MKKYIGMIVLLVMNSCVQAVPFATTFVNQSNITIHLELHFSDTTIDIDNEDIAVSQSQKIISHNEKMLTSVIFSSLDKDKNGNMYGQLQQSFPSSKVDVTYNIALQDVPAHTVAAGVGTESFEMPITQKIVCTLAPIETIKSSAAAKKMIINKNIKKIKQA